MLGERYGIVGVTAPEPVASHWVDASGNEREPFRLSEFQGNWRLLYFFQSWCPGCHSAGFPTLQKLEELLADDLGRLRMCAVQTVFEGFESNTFEALLETQKRYGLHAPFGHDEGKGRRRAGSETMQRYRSGGTPWFVLIDPRGSVVFNDFRIKVEGVLSLLDSEGD
ncbi:peroxiredoxin family protein [Roseibacillus ishigakijimensis]|uniref:TlpA family protein disulfide reductase n=1 Tax=Roseibacillus ishigakijimensis TaxID=454146 RepID=A0A934RP62_9BACT|nr:TlpA disulfide reductase family protein [Roseibacillus ishigakijimensis]MBK1834415.1 TlpA family protein disulfide reductase [Roseibacillus ishigakijimensis]